MLVRRLSALILCVALGYGDAGGRTQDPDSALRRVRESLAAGAYADAVRVARDLVQQAADAGAAPAERARALDLLVEALIGDGQAGAPSTLALARDALALRESHAVEAPLDLPPALHHLAAIHLERGEALRALPLDERALAIRSRLLAADDAALADSLDRVGATLTRLQRIEPARQALVRARAIRDARAADDPLARARTLGLLAAALRDGGEYDEAEALLTPVLAIWRERAPNHPDFAWIQIVAGDVAWLRDNVDAGRKTWASALAVAARTVGEQHAGVVAIQRRLVIAADVLGDRATAQALVDRTLPGARQQLAPCNVERLSLEEYVASRLSYDGAYLETRRQYERSLAAHVTCLGPNHSLTATVLYNLGLLALQMGDAAEADRRLAAATRAWSAGLGINHPFVARGWEALARAAQEGGRWQRARALYERALAARRRGANPHLPLVAWTLTSLADVQVTLGDLAGAERHVNEAIAIFEAEGASDEPDHLARALALRGSILARRGRVEAARGSFAAALAERERIFGASHPLTSQSRADVASADLGLRHFDSAFDGALAAEAGGLEHLRFTIRYLPERQAMTYAAARPHGLDLALSVGAADPRASLARLFDAVIQSRGVVLDELAQRARAIDASRAVAPLVQRAAAARQRYANLVVRSLQEATTREHLDAARAEKEQAEEALAEESVSARAETARVHVGLDGVRTALPADAALVSFVRYDRTIVGPTAGWRAPVASYAAFVLKPDAAPALVPLGSAAALEKLVADWRREASGQALIAGATRADAERAYRVAGVALRRAIWDRLATPLTGAARVFIVPDGQLNVVNFAALPTSVGRFLADEPVLLHYVSTERDLAMPATSATSSGLLAVGGATFDGQATATDTSVARSACEEFSRMRFPALPGSRRELADISRAWQGADARDVTVLSGTAATETAFKREATGRRVVHLATHGFFLGGECIPGMAGTRGVGGLTPRRSTTPANTDNPLLLSGLALAWANRRDKARTSEDDGILTAEEIAGLNLQGTEWAVLSACDTGLGEIKAGEGVFGLRRAFQVAGARTVIMSLWSVEDTAARVWMRALYDGRFKQQHSTADAVRDASRTVLADRRARGASTHPFFWAGFVAAGDWR